MKKKLLALAVAGAFVAPVAMADTANVNVYGVADVSFDITNNGTTTAGGAAGTGTGTHKVSSNQSRIGLKGSEDLGGGTSAIWQIEQLINIDNSGANTAASPANGFATRNTFAGLSSGSMGTVLLGRHDTPYKLATRGLDMFADTIADNRSLMGMTAGGAASHDARLTDVIAYISPAMSGFTAAVAYVAGAEAATLSTNVKGAAWSLAGMYNAGPINASLSYQAIDVGTVGTGTMAVGGGVVPAGAVAASDKFKAWKVGGGYTIDAFSVGAAYERTTSSVAAVAGDAAAQNNWYLAGKYNVSASDAVKLAYTKAGTNPQAAGTATVANSGAKQISLGYDHNMSKRTTVYALYTKLNNDSAATYGLGIAGNTGAVANLGAGASPSAWSLGMKHTF